MATCSLYRIKDNGCSYKFYCPTKCYSERCSTCIELQKQFCNTKCVTCPRENDIGEVHRDSTLEDLAGALEW
jgi:hypothetical protein